MPSWAPSPSALLSCLRHTFSISGPFWLFSFPFLERSWSSLPPWCQLIFVATFCLGASQVVFLLGVQICLFCPAGARGVRPVPRAGSAHVPRGGRPSQTSSASPPDPARAGGAQVGQHGAHSPAGRGAGAGRWYWWLSVTFMSWGGGAAQSTLVSRRPRAGARALEVPGPHTAEADGCLPPTRSQAPACSQHRAQPIEQATGHLGVLGGLLRAVCWGGEAGEGWGPGHLWGIWLCLSAYDCNRDGLR